MQQPSPVQPSIAQLRGQQENVIVASIAVVDKESSSGPSEWREREKEGRGHCVLKGGFYKNISWETRCNCGSQIWSHFYI